MPLNCVGALHGTAWDRFAKWQISLIWKTRHQTREISNGRACGRETVTFGHPFQLGGLDGALPVGLYTIDVAER